MTLISQEWYEPMSQIPARPVARLCPPPPRCTAACLAPVPPPQAGTSMRLSPSQSQRSCHNDGLCNLSTRSVMTSKYTSTVNHLQAMRRALGRGMQDCARNTNLVFSQILLQEFDHWRCVMHHSFDRLGLRCCQEIRRQQNICEEVCVIVPSD